MVEKEQVKRLEAVSPSVIQLNSSVWAGKNLTNIKQPSADNHNKTGAHVAIRLVVLKSREYRRIQTIVSSLQIFLTINLLHSKDSAC